MLPDWWYGSDRGYWKQRPADQRGRHRTPLRGLGTHGGDEGGAWWIAQQAVKTYFDATDNIRVPARGSTSGQEKMIFEHFKIYKVWYAVPVRELFSSPSTHPYQEPSHGSHNDGDGVCLDLFAAAGRARRLR